MQRIVITLHREPPEGARVAVAIDGHRRGEAVYGALPQPLLNAHSVFLAGGDFEEDLLELGRELGKFALPERSAQFVAEAIDGSPLVEVSFEADDPELLALPFESLRLPDGRLLATQPAAIMLRRPAGLQPPPASRLAGPLKILVAVGAPDEEYGGGAVLDQERELQNVLDAVEATRREEELGVRILEVGHPNVIAEAIAVDDYHVLHLSCHGMPGALLLEDEDGRPVLTTARGLIEPILETGRSLPLVLLNSCHGGAHHRQSASLAVQLLEAGVPAVIAMQTSVSDRYATALAHAFYRHLAGARVPLASAALAAARKELEQARLTAIGRGTRADDAPPEYATAACFAAGEESPVIDFALPAQPLRIRPVFEAPGPVPQLRIDDLIGRRTELRRTLQTLRDGASSRAGVVLTGIGGIGKSVIAGRVMQRLLEDGWIVAAIAGRLDLAAIAPAVGEAMRASGRAEGSELTRADLDDRRRLELVSTALSVAPLLLVLDDFEQNLTLDGAFADPNIAGCFTTLAGAAGVGRMLVTSRYPIPGPAAASFERIAVGPLSAAQTRKLLLRLPALDASLSGDAEIRVRIIDGHPRMLELVDALLRSGDARLPAVARKLDELLAEHHEATSVDMAFDMALSAGMRDVLLDELLALARRDGVADVLLQTAVSNLPVPAAGLARMLDKDEAAVERALQILADRSLVHRVAGGSAWVHRWTAEGLARLEEDEAHRFRCALASEYRWEVAVATRDGYQGVEAVRNALAARDFDRAAAYAYPCFDGMTRDQQSASLAALAAEILAVLPEAHSQFSFIVDAETTALVTLGFSDRARARLTTMLERNLRFAADPGQRFDVLHNLAVTYIKLADVGRRMGDSEEARRLFESARAAFDELLAARPDEPFSHRARAGLRSKMGDLHAASGESELARAAYVEALDTLQRLAAAAPEDADLQRDLALGWSRISGAHAERGEFEEARAALDESRQIRERLLAADPANLLLQSGVAVILEHLGFLDEQLGDSLSAHAAYERSLRLRETAWESEPDRTDYQRDLSVGLEHFADICKSLGRLDEARQAYIKSLALTRRVAAAEPNRADYQNDLGMTFHKISDYFDTIGATEQAREANAQALAIFRRIAEAEPNRADYQRNVALALNARGDACAEADEFDEALAAYSESLEIRERLALAEPHRADRRRDLAVVYGQLGAMYARRDDWERSGDYNRQAQAIEERLVADEPQRVDYQRHLAWSTSHVGDAAVMMRKPEEAIEAYERSLASFERIAELDPERIEHLRGIASVFIRMAAAYGMLQRHDDTARAHRGAMATIRRATNAHPDNAGFRDMQKQIGNEASQFLWRFGDAEGSFEAARQSIEAREWMAKASDVRVAHWYELAHFYTQFANICGVVKKPEEALQAHTRAIEILEELRKHDPDDPDFVETLVQSCQAASTLNRELGREAAAFEMSLRALTVTDEYTAGTE